ncbi:Uncharacterized protein APZ42_004225, partial [Daphnia magna]
RKTTLSFCKDYYTSLKTKYVSLSKNNILRDNTVVNKLSFIKCAKKKKKNYGCCLALTMLQCRFEGYQQSRTSYQTKLFLATSKIEN